MFAARAGQVFRRRVVLRSGLFGLGRRNLAIDLVRDARVRIEQPHRDLVFIARGRRLCEHYRDAESEQRSQQELSRACAGLVRAHAMSSHGVLPASAGELRSEAVTWVQSQSASGADDATGADPAM